MTTLPSIPFNADVVDVNNPVRSGSKYLLRAFVDIDGKRRQRTRTYDTREEALEAAHVLRRMMREAMVERTSKADALAGEYDSSAMWYMRRHGDYEAKLWAAASSGDHNAVVLWSKAVTAFAALSRSAAAQRDISKLEAALEQAEELDRQRELAGRYGSRISAAQTHRASDTQATDPVH